MYKNPYWLTLISFMILCAALYSGYSLYKMYMYSRLSQQVHVNAINWSIEEINDEKFIPKANFQFFYDNKEYSSEILWDESYPNALVANDVVNKLSSYSWRVWIDPSNPEHSALQKKFPYKDAISSIILWMIIVYFFCLGYNVKNGSNHP